ncbi:MAG: ATP-dependent helicase [Rhodovibrionaceae bacterium]|nr:ATP-dependent helicase [Rhodovibrionaceae bacterium]
MRAAAELVGTDEIKPAARRSLSDLLAQFANWRAYAQEASLPELVETVLDESGYVEMWRADKSIEAPGRLENLKELVSAVAEFENLEAFLEHIGLVMENLEGAHGDMVNVMTLHAAKGLEFDTVFLPGWEEGLFPNQRALDETGLKALEEERRLAYVGLTRARQKVVVSFAANRRMHGSWAAAIPSRFVDELPEDHVEVESDTGYTAGAAGTGWGGGWHDLGWGSGWTGAGQGRRYTGDAPRPTPGMARAERNRGRVQPFIETTHREVETLGGNARFGEGERVFHRKFGYGTVGRIEGERLTIAFDHAGQKKVMADFVVPADEAD